MELDRVLFSARLTANRGFQILRHNRDRAAPFDRVLLGVPSEKEPTMWLVEHYQLAAVGELNLMTVVLAVGYNPEPEFVV